MMLAMIFSRLTETSGYGSHPLSDRLEFDNRDGGPKSNEKLIRHRLRAYALQLMTGFIEAKTGEFTEKRYASHDSYFNSSVSYPLIPSLKFFDKHNRKEIEDAYDNAFLIKPSTIPHSITIWPTI